MAIQNKTPLHKQFEIMKILANLIPINWTHRDVYLQITYSEGRIRFKQYVHLGREEVVACPSLLPSRHQDHPGLLNSTELVTRWSRVCAVPFFGEKCLHPHVYYKQLNVQQKNSFYPQQALAVSVLRVGEYFPPISVGLFTLTSSSSMAPCKAQPRHYETCTSSRPGTN